MNSTSPKPTDRAGEAPSGGDPDTQPSAPAAILPRWEMDAGMMLRCREWVDLFPWLRLVRVVRLAASPIWLALVALTAILWQTGIGFFAGRVLVDGFPVGVATAMPSDLLLPVTFVRHGDATLLVIWTALVWLPVAMALTHLGGRLTAGRDLPSPGETFRLVVRRGFQALAAGWIPLAIGLPLWWMLAGIEGLLDWSDTAWWLEVLTAPPLFFLSLVISVIGVLGKVAVPLAIAAVTLERDPDPLDALSRGYEYVLRRFLSTVCLVLWAAAIVLVIVAGWAVVSTVAIKVLAPTPSNSPAWAVLLSSEAVRGAGSAPWVTGGLAQLPAVVLMTLGWGMVGGGYLCLRQAAGGQEVEDLAIDDQSFAPVSLPSVSRRETEETKEA